MVSTVVVKAGTRRSSSSLCYYYVEERHSASRLKIYTTKAEEQMGDHENSLKSQKVMSHQAPDPTDIHGSQQGHSKVIEEKFKKFKLIKLY